MKKIVLSIASLLMLTVGIVSCKGGKAKEAEVTPATEQATTAAPAKEEAAATTTTGNAPKTYQFSFAPDTLYLGKEKEAFIKMLSGEAVELQDQEGKSTGTAIKFNMRATNKSTLEKQKYFAISYSDARLELDNGTNKTPNTGSSLNPEPESSKEATWEFEIPAGTKAVKLNLFYDGTRVPVALIIK